MNNETFNKNSNFVKEYNINSFKLPIEYNKNIQITANNIITDLELIKSNEENGNNIYNIVFSPNHIFAQATMPLWAKYYTTDKNYLKETQKLITNFSKLDNSSDKDDSEFNNIYNIFNDIKNDKEFLNKYFYIDISWLKYLNNNSNILQLLSYYNISSPILSILFPIIILLIPFFILKSNGTNITINHYFDLLKSLVKTNPVGNILFNFNEASYDKKLYSIISLTFYIFQIYENIKCCIKFHKNLDKIHNYLFKIKDYITYTINSFNHYKNQTSKLISYKPFINFMETQQQILLEYNNDLHKITNWKYNIPKLLNIGIVMKNFYLSYFYLILFFQ